MYAYLWRPPDPAGVGEGWRAAWLERLRAQRFMLRDWGGHQRRDAYWKHGSVCEDYGAIRAAVYAIGGWEDGYTNTVPRSEEHTSELQSLMRISYAVFCLKKKIKI